MYGSEQAALVSGYWLELSSAQTLFESAFEHRRQFHLLALGVFVHAVAAECDVLNHGVHTIRPYVQIRQITVCVSKLRFGHSWGLLRESVKLRSVHVWSCTAAT